MIIDINLNKNLENSAFYNDESKKLFSKTRRNEPCPCGSGKKYKHCHGALS
ncbi:SEC-C metal-binding domain-containing protein [Candidatus Kinetoplastidibacterium blastocrithidiae]